MLGKCWYLVYAVRNKYLTVLSMLRHATSNSSNDMVTADVTKDYWCEILTPERVLLLVLKLLCQRELSDGVTA